VGVARVVRACCGASAIALVASLSGTSQGGDATVASASAGASFTFTAAADYADSNGTAATLDAIGAVQPAFHLAVGDFSYDPNTSPSDWCSFARGHIPASIPIEIVAGNREDLSGGKEGPAATQTESEPTETPPTTAAIDSYASCLPDGIGDAVGDYGREYFFDYPPQDPVARFIMLSPGLTFADGTRHYTAGGPHYMWAARTIDDARAHQIPWVIVAAHKPCLTSGVQNCAAGRDFLNLMVSKRVDLVLDGHDHSYQRSKQLALNGTTCPALAPDAYNPDCVADAAEDNTYQKGDGTVLAIVGTGGATQTGINLDSPVAPYFASTWDPSDDRATGFLSVSLSATELRASYQSVWRGNFADQFTITTNPSSSAGSGS